MVNRPSRVELFPLSLQSLHHTMAQSPVSPHIRNLPSSQSPLSGSELAGGDGGAGGTCQLYLPATGLQCPHKAGSISAGLCGSVRS